MMSPMRTFIRPDSCWALPISWQRWLEASVRLYVSGATPSEACDALPEVAAATLAQRQEVPQSSVAVIPVIGPVSYRSDWMMEFFGGASVSAIAGQLRRAAADPNVTAIVMPIDSPGGSVYGLMELAQQMRSVRASKPVITIADPMAASAAYYIGAQGTEFSITPSGEAGSIGVFMMHVDMSQALEDQGIKVTFISQGKYKTEGNPYEPLSDEAATALQATVDHYYNGFLADVAKGRGVSVKDVRGGFGQGRMLTAPDALAAGMVDRIGTFSDTLDRVASGKWKAPTMKKAEELRLKSSDDPDKFKQVAEKLAEATRQVVEVDRDASVQQVTDDPEPAPPAPADMAAEDGYDELAAAYLGEWEQSDAETITRG